MAKDIKYFILTGEPGVGKTTLITKLCKLLNETGIKTSGFITEEVRENRVRKGFDVVTLDGVQGKLARDQQLLGAPSKYTVGKYGVLISDFERVAIPTLQMVENGCLVIDEIGKMEFFSLAFKNKIKELFDERSNNFILATIPIRKSDNLIEGIRNNKKTRLWIVVKRLMVPKLAQLENTIMGIMREVGKNPPGARLPDKYTKTEPIKLLFDQNYKEDACIDNIEACLKEDKRRKRILKKLFFKKYNAMREELIGYGGRRLWGGEGNLFY
ncbi:nucleoside-triphosphatase THEP1 [Aricia agestis]|uniref:nucleoside-triphosphatase THEP1 n=1 Tax=Aricia agestis TaxID=91739 RepID=UPI001C2043AB|nr:nucleoside-triphosphatase THEP1 [Aricia agestis]